MGANGSHQPVGSSMGDVQLLQEVDKSSGAYKTWEQIRHCARKAPGKKSRILGTVFSRSLNSPEDGKLVNNGIQMLKQLRHPSVLHFIDCVRSSTEVTLITERVDVLDVVANSMNSAEIRAGLLDVVNALVFLHEKAGISHNSISPSAIFVTPDGRWKLGSFECATRMNIESPDVKDFIVILEFLAQMVDEETADEFDTLKARLCDGTIEFTTLLQSGRLHSPLFEITDFLEHVQLKADDEKVEFYRDLPGQLALISPESIAKRLIRLFLSRYVMLDERAHETFLPHLFNMNDILDEDLYRTYLIPEILRIFGVRDKAIRLALLRHFHLYHRHLESTACATRILPELSLGMYDTDNEIVSASLRAMADLVDVLGGEIVTGSVHTKHFSDGTPKPLKSTVAPQRSVATSEASTPSRYIATSSSTSATSDTPERKPSEVTVDIEMARQEDDEWSTSWDVQETETEIAEHEQEREEPAPHDEAEAEESIAAENPAPCPNSVRSEKSTMGSEFSLPQIKAPVEDEVDFFADMEPKFDSAPSLVESLKSRALMEASSSYLGRQAVLPVKFTLFNSDKESSAETELEPDATDANGASAWEAEDDLIIE